MANALTEEEQDAFMTELTILTKKYGIVIGGCGCCSSPYLTKGETVGGHYVINKDYADELVYITPGSCYWDANQ